MSKSSYLCFTHYEPCFADEEDLIMVRRMVLFFLLHQVQGGNAVRPQTKEMATRTALDIVKQSLHTQIPAILDIHIYGPAMCRYTQ
jgi:hypothetical protein